MLESMATFQPKFNWGTPHLLKHQPTGSLSCTILNKETPHFDIEQVTSWFFLLQEFKNSLQSLSSRVFFCVSISWIDFFFRRNPGRKQVVTMVAFMDTTRIQVHFFSEFSWAFLCLGNPGMMKLFLKFHGERTQQWRWMVQMFFPFQMGDLQVPAVSFPGCS